ncbi:MAG TPA: DUF885 domain-containing protein [Kofleriaceae bacterium]|nr:DUF885 domain-containing protein [Kofleriaceae bacterium]
MHTRALALLLCAACGGSAPPPAPPRAPEPAPAPAPAPALATPAPDLATRRAALSALLDEQWEYNLKTSPEFASFLGDHRYDDKWSDLSDGAIAADHAKVKEFLARFEAIDTTGFPEQEALNKELMVRALRQQVDNMRFENWLMPVNQMSGLQLQLPQLPAVLRFETVADYENYLTRLHGIPKLFDQTTALLREGIAKHLVPPKILLAQCVTQTRGLSQGKATDSPFAAPIVKFPDSIAKADQDRLRAAIVAAVKDEVMPSYAKFATYLEHDYVPQGRADPGEWALPDGDARYAADVRESTTTELTPEQIHQIGLAEVTRIEGEEAKLATKLGFKSLDKLREHVRTDPKLYAKDRDDILKRYNGYVAQMYEKLPTLFGRLPKQHMQVKEVESFRAKAAAGAEYQPGAPDGSRPGVIRVNTSDPKHRLTINMESTAYHEGVPGHHMQITIQQELGELPKFRQHGGYTAFDEGWALYAERLGEDVGFYKDPWSMYGHLEDEMLRAIRLVVDTGFHYKRWTRDQVVKFFHDHSAIDEPSVQSETDRYIAWPAQALGYKIGQLTILRLRDEARAALGDAFDIRAFHDEVLGAGALPMDVLERRIHAWIERTKSGATSGASR